MCNKLIICISVVIVVFVVAGIFAIKVAELFGSGAYVGLLIVGLLLVIFILKNCQNDD